MDSRPQAAGDIRDHTLVTTAWVEARLDDPKVRLVEVCLDVAVYRESHIPGAVGWRWIEDTREALGPGDAGPARFEDLMCRCGIANDTTIVLYDDNNNWLAILIFWLLKIHGHDDVRLLRGGRRAWLLEDRPVTTYVSRHKPTAYRARPLDAELRALRQIVWSTLDHML